MNRLYMTAVMKLIPPPCSFVTHNGTQVEVEIVEKPMGHKTALVSATHGFPFDMEHGYGDYIVHDGKYWYAKKWVNLEEIEER